MQYFLFSCCKKYFCIFNKEWNLWEPVCIFYLINFFMSIMISLRLVPISRQQGKPFKKGPVTATAAKACLPAAQGAPPEPCAGSGVTWYPRGLYGLNFLCPWGQPGHGRNMRFDPSPQGTVHPGSSLASSQVLLPGQELETSGLPPVTVGRFRINQCFLISCSAAIACRSMASQQKRPFMTRFSS